MQMIKTAAAKPDARQFSINRSLNESGMLADPTPKAFGMSVSNKMIEVCHTHAGVISQHSVDLV